MHACAASSLRRVHITGLWRHPVKSLQGEPVDVVTLGHSGVVGDRAWAVRDVASGAVLSAKREPRLLLAAARVRGEGVLVAAPAESEADGADVDRRLSAWLDRAVRLDLAPDTAYVDEAHLHLLCAAELGEWDVRRFRPNVVVGGVATLEELVGERLALGRSAVVEVVKRTKRCAMPTMRQPGIDKDVDVLRTLARGRDLRLGVYARVVSPGTFEVGAPITVA
jgi:uncharacterized protein YcbX